MSRFIVAAAVLLAATAALVGCTEEKDPEPQWTEESAYAAAEETFRAYWAASISGEGRQVEAQYVTGDMLDMYSPEEDHHQPNVESRGDAMVSTFETKDFRLVDDTAAVEAIACIDASTYELKADDGSWYSPRGDGIYGVSLRFAAVGDEMLVEDLAIAEGVRC